MSFNGSGTFVINSAGQPVVANTVISATTFNALTADLANGLTTCITKDGQTTPTANIPMGGFKITNLATGTAATDAATVAQIQSNGAALVTVTGTDTLTGSLTPALVAYVTGAVYYFVAPATNTGAVTLNIDTLGAKNVTRDGTTALVAGDIVSGEMVAVVYDGTRFQLISPVNSFTNLNVSGTLTVAGATTLNGNLAVGDAATDTINFKSSGWTLTNNVSVTGTWADIGTITTADINGGTIDGTTIGGGTAAAGTFTTATATTGNITTVNATTVDSTNLEVSNLKAKDGTAAGSIADATGVVTLNSVVATTADINGGTIDATTIGGSSPAVGNFTTVSAASAVFTTATITTVNTTTLDLTNLEVTNIKAKDGTASMTIDDATGKVNVTTVSAASMNAGVAAVTSLTATGASVASANVGTAVITNGTVTALTATGASIASMNAGVALLTTATVTNFTASGASIASANIGNLQFTAASIASINAGVAVITDLTATSASVASANLGVAVVTTGTVTNFTATGASIASANVGTAVITAATVTGASIASMNAGVALLTTATVTNLTATGASIASANVGTLALTRLDVAAASVASANAGVAVITTGTVTNLTSTSASIASMNAGVALLTTATVTNLTATGASVASANLGTAVITGMTVTGASIASVNAGTATLSGNLTLNGGTASGVVYLNGSKVATSGSALTWNGTTLDFGSTAQRITADMSNATVSNRFAFQNNVTNGSSVVSVLPNGTNTTSAFRTHNANDPTNSAWFQITSTSTDSRLNSSINGTGTYLPITFYTSGAEVARFDTSGTFRVKGAGTAGSTDAVQFDGAAPASTLILNSSGNLGIGTTSPITKLNISGGGSAVYQTFTNTAGTYNHFYIGNPQNALTFGNSNLNGSFSANELMRLTDTGNVGIGTASPAAKLDVAGTIRATGGPVDSIYTGTTAGSVLGSFRAYGTGASVTGETLIRGVLESGSITSSYLEFGTASSGTLSEKMRITSSGNLGLGVTPSAWATSGTILKALQIGAAGSFAAGASDPSVHVSQNAYFDGTNWRYIQSAAAGNYYVSGNTHNWRIAGSGTAGNAITFTQAMTLDASGNLLVGKTSTSDTVVGVLVSPNGSVSQTNAASANTTVVNAIYSTGASAYRFYVGLGGTVYATNTTISAISDQRYKENVRDLDIGLDAVMALKPRKFDWKEGKGKNTKNDRGFIAQEFEQVFPDLIDEWKDPAPEGEEPYKSVRQDLIPVLVKAIQELKAELDAAKVKIAALEAK
jgi:hypothetical protein